MVAVWTALLIAVGIALSLSAMKSGRTDFESPVGEEPGPRGTTTAIRPWPEATEVRLFVEDVSYDERARTGVTMSNPKGVVLNAVQRATLDRSVTLYRMTAKEYANAVSAACFIPHHFFRYYDKSGRQLGELAVCYCCGGVDFSPAFRNLRRNEEWQFDFDAVEKMLKEMGVPTEVNCDA
ncbi:hypothetical protein LH19_23130 [Sphingopyxis macrogoltabida]|nr:hypothetical protein LH19_23130 [Sphingopyxis macrogoltabida]